jgi:hypothetical protein
LARDAVSLASCRAKIAACDRSTDFCRERTTLIEAIKRFWFFLSAEARFCRVVEMSARNRSKYKTRTHLSEYFRYFTALLFRLPSWRFLRYYPTPFLLFSIIRFLTVSYYHASGDTGGFMNDTRLPSLGCLRFPFRRFF